MKTNYKFYDAGNDGGILLELHSERTINKIDKNFLAMDYEEKIEEAIFIMESHFKNLEVLIRGRGGRHICVKDTPVNRRRYNNLVIFAKKLEQNLVNYFNNEYVMEEI